MKGQFLPYKDENPAHRFPLVTTALIILNVAVFLWSLTDFEATIGTWGFTPADFVLLTLLTSMFLHGGIDHIFGNMLFLHIYGDNVEDRLGRLPYLAFYLVAGLAAALTHYVTDPTSLVPTIGASGAISGVLGAYLVLFPHVKVRTLVGTGFFFRQVRLPAYVLIGFWFLLQLVFGTVSLVGGVGSGIAFFAHIGGFAFGYLVVRVATWLR
ncbi:MAG: rhomboid family intramembrane serine protease [Candidatus Aenigmarchaeota archaeon]|nr:rhomboid family intramembrane serine protease [Candidatus Aenigmarchaeota archaeon]